jgi:hypothetical protein
MESSSFSDPKIIGRLNKAFVPLMLNVTDDGFPTELGGLASWQRAWKWNPFYRVAFASSVVLDSSGQVPLGTSGAGYDEDAVNYNPPKYLAWLEQAQGRFERYQQLQQPSAPDRAQRLEQLRQEVMAELKNASKRTPDRME